VFISIPKFGRKILVFRRCRCRAERAPEPVRNLLNSSAKWQFVLRDGRTRRMGSTTESVVDQNRVGGETELAYWNNQPRAVVRFGMKVYFHFRFRGWWFYCGRADSFAGVFPGVSEFNLARIALALTMPTIFARTEPLTK
jgi:hypothetical protein